MIALTKKYAVPIYSFLIMLSLITILNWVDIIRINPSAFLENLFIFSIWWGLATFVGYKIPYLKKNKSVLYKIIGLILMLVLVLVAENYLKTRDNPISLPLLILFWLGVFSLLLPKFFKKYQVGILGIYGLILAYFLYLRLGTAYSNEHHDQAIFSMMIPVPFIFLLWVFEQWKWLKILQAEKGKAELALLKSQINPHFFFNTLNNLYGLAVEKSDKAPEMILKLSDIMRYTIYDGKADFVPLVEEVAYLENYIELHKIRYQKKVVIDFKKDMHPSCKIAPLLFVILLENAFKHGVEKLTEKAYIYIKLSSTKDKVSFQIDNNYEPNLTTHVGIGLNNLKKRLALIYPQKHQLQLQKTENTYSATLEIELT